MYEELLEALKVLFMYYNVRRSLANLRCALFVLKIQPSKVYSTDPGGSKPVFNWLKDDTKLKSQNVVQK